jgi:hypothetical protein
MKGNKFKVLIFIVALVIAFGSRPALADDVLLTWSGSGSSGVDPYGLTWFAANNQENGDGSWGIPGLGLGTLLWAGPVPITDFNITFSGLPEGVVIDSTPAPGVGGYDESTRFDNDTVDVLWNRLISGDTVSFIAQNESGTLLPGQAFFVNVAFTGPIDLENLSFEAQYTTSTVPEPSTFLLLGAGLAGVGLLRRKFKSQS